MKLIIALVLSLVWLLAGCTSGTTTTSAASTLSEYIPTLSSLSPTSGATGGGTTVIIYGSNFVSGAEVYFGGVAATSVVFISSTELEAVSPVISSTGAVSVEVISDGYSATLSSAFTYGGATAQPTVSSISPTSSAESGGTNVIIYGANFAVGDTVVIGSVSCLSVSVVSSSEISCYTGAYSAVASGLQVTVTNSSGLSGSLSGVFSYVASATGTPTIASVVPAYGSISGGTTVLIYGSNFVSGSGVTIGGIACASVSYISASELSCITGAASVSETASVVVVNPTGYSAILANAYTYSASGSFILSSVTPSSGSASGGTQVYVYGSGFTSGMQVYFGSQACTSLSLISTSELTCYTPAGSGVVSVQMIGTAGSSNILSSAYSYSGNSTSTLSLSFTASAGGNQTLYSDQPVTLSWSSNNATSCQIDWADNEAVLASGLSGSVGVPAADYVNDDTYLAECTNSAGQVAYQTLTIDRVLYAVGGSDHGSYRLQSLTDATLCAKNIAAKSSACSKAVRIGKTRAGVNQGLSGVAFDSPSSCKCNSSSGYYPWD